MKALIVAIFALCTLSAVSQSADELRKQMKRYEAEIAQINKLIQSNSKQQATTMQNLKLVNQKIKNRQKIINNLDKQIEAVEKQLGAESIKVIELSGEMSALRHNYSELVRVAYLNYRQNSVPTLVGSDARFWQSSRNVLNTSYLSRGLKQKIYNADTTQRHIQGQIDLLTTEQQRLAELMAQRSGEVKQLEREKKQLSAMTAQLSGKGAELNKKMADNRQKLQALQKQIAAIVAKESKENKAAQASRPTNYALSSVFEQNIGKLPSPVSGGVVVDRFGVQNNPTQPGIKIENTGINIACSVGSSVVTIFEGEVREIFPAASMGNCVLIRHGKYLTVYSGLGTINVKKGEKVSTGKKIGTIDPTIKILHFEIWNETTVLDPEKWLTI